MTWDYLRISSKLDEPDTRPKKAQSAYISEQTEAFLSSGGQIDVYLRDKARDLEDLKASFGKKRKRTSTLW